MQYFLSANLFNRNICIYKCLTADISRGFGLSQVFSSIITRPLEISNYSHFPKGAREKKEKVSFIFFKSRKYFQAPNLESLHFKFYDSTLYICIINCDKCLDQTRLVKLIFLKIKFRQFFLLE